MSNLKDIPVTPEGARARSGEKYVTPQGFTAIRDGVKARGGEVMSRTGAQACRLPVVNPLPNPGLGRRSESHRGFGRKLRLDRDFRA